MHARVLALAALVSSTAATAAPEAAMQPTGKWVVNFADAQCIATRNYGTESDPLYLMLKAPAVGDTIQLGIIRKGGKLDANQLEGEIVFDEAPPLRTSFLEFGVRSMGQRARFVTLAAKDVASMRQAKTIRLRVREKGIERLGTRFGLGQATGEDAFAVTSMPALLGTLANCTADLESLERREWRIGFEGGSVRESRSTVQFRGLSRHRRLEGPVGTRLTRDPRRRAGQGCRLHGDPAQRCRVTGFAKLRGD